MVRPLKNPDEVRSDRQMIRWTDAERALLAKAAAILKTDQSDFVRSAALERAAKVIKKKPRVV